MTVQARHPGMMPMLRFESGWCAPWMLTALTQQGLNHYNQGVPNMDACKVGSVGRVAWLTVADGVGSKPMSYKGSNLAVDAVYAHFRTALANGDSPSPKMLQDAFTHAHAELDKATRQLKIPITDYATTLATAIIADDVVYTASIGDSSIVALSAPFAEGAGELIPLCSAPQPKQKGATLSIVNPNWLTFTAFNETKAGNIKAVLLASDGGEDFFASTPPSGETAFEAQFLNAFDHALKVLTPRAFSNFFSEYIARNEANNNDDRTILIAYRVPAELAPPAPVP